MTKGELACIGYKAICSKISPVTRYEKKIAILTDVINILAGMVEAENASRENKPEE